MQGQNPPKHCTQEWHHDTFTPSLHLVPFLQATLAYLWTINDCGTSTKHCTPYSLLASFQASPAIPCEENDQINQSPKALMEQPWVICLYLLSLPTQQLSLVQQACTLQLSFLAVFYIGVIFQIYLGARLPGCMKFYLHSTNGQHEYLLYVYRG